MNTSSWILFRELWSCAVRRSCRLTHFLFTGLLVSLGSTVQMADAAGVLPPVPEYHPDRILVMPKAEVSSTSLAGFHAAQRVERLRSFPGVGGLQVLQLPEGETVASLIAKYQGSGLVEFAEPDYARTLALTPNDPSYVNGTLWGLNNTGQSGGKSDADIDAPEAWDVLTAASNIVVATLDTGIRRTHEDLAANVWTNASGYGWNALAGTNAPADDEGHGTLVAGILGGVGNNGKGVAGVAWRVQIMACKCFNGQRVGYDSDIIACLEYARTNGAKVINASLGGTGFSQSLSNAVYSAREAGIILVASAGNDAANVDVQPQYPACYDLDNIVSVAATTRSDALWGSSNYGATTWTWPHPGTRSPRPSSSTTASISPSPARRWPRRTCRGRWP
jgi:subtilisin family serine protease